VCLVERIIIDQKDERMEQDGDNYPKEGRRLLSI
jgi:hypothetical protein